MYYNRILYALKVILDLPYGHVLDPDLIYEVLIPGPIRVFVSNIRGRIVPIGV